MFCPWLSLAFAMSPLACTCRCLLHLHRPLPCCICLTTPAADTDGCDGGNTNCGTGATCTDTEAPGTGYTCSCETGYTGNDVTDGVATCTGERCGSCSALGCRWLLQCHRLPAHAAACSTSHMVLWCRRRGSIVGVFRNYCY